MKVALCCIGRLENQYAKEFIEHNKKLGFNKIFIYDNNHDGEEHFEDVLQPYVETSLVEIIDYRNKEKAQFEAYNDCYSKHKNEYDWFAFFDFDEFLILTDGKRKISSFLSQFKGFQCVLINWMIMDDNGLVKNDKKPLMKRFKHPMEYDKTIKYSFPQNNHVKSIIKGGLDISFQTNPHIPSSNLLCCDAEGKPCDSSPFKQYTFKGAYLKHFFTKTIEEWVQNKMKRGYPDGNKDWFDFNNGIDLFFDINEKTEEKEKYIKENVRNKIKIFICTHKAFNLPVRKNIYEVISTKPVANKTPIKVHFANEVNLPLNDNFYSELYSIKYICDKIDLPEYIGVCHYRRYFAFLDEIPNMDEVFEKYDAVVAKPIAYDLSIKKQYELYHNIEDLYITGGIISDLYPQYSTVWHNFINGTTFFPYNMVILKREDFKKYCEFIFNILDKYLEIVGKDVMKNINNNNEKYIKDFYPNNTIEYQHRIGGYIGERLTNVFILANFKKVMISNVIITEDKYKKNEQQK